MHSRRSSGGQTAGGVTGGSVTAPRRLGRAARPWPASVGCGAGPRSCHGGGGDRLGRRRPTATAIVASPREHDEADGGDGRGDQRAGDDRDRPSPARALVSGSAASAHVLGGGDPRPLESASRRASDGGSPPAPAAAAATGGGGGTRSVGGGGDGGAATGTTLGDPAAACAAPSATPCFGWASTATGRPSSALTSCGDQRDPRRAAGEQHGSSGRRPRRRPSAAPGASAVKRVGERWADHRLELRAGQADLGRQRWAGAPGSTLRCRPTAPPWPRRTPRAAGRRPPSPPGRPDRAGRARRRGAAPRGRRPPRRSRRRRAARCPRASRAARPRPPSCGRTAASNVPPPRS